MRHQQELKLKVTQEKDLNDIEECLMRKYDGRFNMIRQRQVKKLRGLTQIEYQKDWVVNYTEEEPPSDAI